MVVALVLPFGSGFITNPATHDAFAGIVDEIEVHHANVYTQGVVEGPDLETSADDMGGYPLIKGYSFFANVPIASDLGKDLNTNIAAVLGLLRGGASSSSSLAGSGGLVDSGVNIATPLPPIVFWQPGSLGSQ